METDSLDAITGAIQRKRGIGMERLTDRNADGDYFYPKCFEKCDGLGASRKCDNCEITTSICEKLGKYEDLDEQGRLVKLPCKIGDIIYRVNAGAKEPVIKMIVLQVNYKQLREDRIIIRIDAMNDNDMGESCYLLEDFGKNVFITKSEAEAKLKELRGAE